MKRKTIFIWSALSLVGIALVCVAFGLGVSRFTCQGEEKLKVDDPSGIHFEVEYKSCDTLAKEEFTSIYASRTLEKGAGMVSKWRNKRTLLFRYDPGREDGPLPSITHPTQSTILISIPEVSSIGYQNREWEKMSVNYAIGRIDYPTSSK